MSDPEEQPVPTHPVAGADAGSRTDVTWVSPAAAEVAAKLLQDHQPSDTRDLITAANEAARAVHTAARFRDKAIRRAIAAGADLDQLATATGLSIEQLQRIQLSD